MAHLLSITCLISIHALRGEGDHYYAVVGLCFKISIHALRGEGDCVLAQMRSSSSHFNPRPPWGGRQDCREMPALWSVFQSTPSVGRATTPAEIKTWQDLQFQSTPSVGRATFSLLEFVPLYDISIHALRGEGDTLRRRVLSKIGNFNPRPPWGGRLRLP